MGSFLGHALPGAFFISFGLWWAYNVFRRYYLCLRSSETGGASTYASTASFSSSCNPRLPLEGLMKVLVVIIGMSGELATAFVDGKFIYMGNSQHMTMFFFFGLNGVVDIMTHYRAPFPPNVDYVSAIMAFAVEGVLFFYHLHNRTAMDVQLHMLLIYVVGACVLSTAMEMYHKTSVLPALARTYFVLLQGIWFFQVGFILYPPVGGKWTEDSPRQMTMVTNIFCWHMAGVFILLLAMGWVIHTRVRTLSSTSVYEKLHLHPLARDEYLAKLDPEQIRQILEDSEEEDDV